MNRKCAALGIAVLCCAAMAAAEEVWVKRPSLSIREGKGAAFATVATGFSAGQADHFPQIIQEQNVVGDGIGADAAVERKLQNARRHDLCLRLRLVRIADSIAITPKPFKPCHRHGRSLDGGSLSRESAP